MSSWAFNFRTRARRTDSDSSSSSSSSSPGPYTSSPTRNPSSETELWNDLDFSKREEPQCVPEYKPNPFSIARINAATRMMQKPKDTAKPAEEKRRRPDETEEEGTIAHAFKRQKQTKENEKCKEKIKAKAEDYSGEPIPILSAPEPSELRAYATPQFKFKPKSTRFRPPAPVKRASPTPVSIAAASSPQSSPAGSQPRMMMMMSSPSQELPIPTKATARDVFKPSGPKPQSSSARSFGSPLAIGPASVDLSHSPYTTALVPKDVTNLKRHFVDPLRPFSPLRPPLSANRSPFRRQSQAQNVDPRHSAHAQSDSHISIEGSSPAPLSVVNIITLPPVDPTPPNNARKRPSSPVYTQSSSSPAPSSPSPAPRKNWRMVTVAQQEEDAEWSTLPVGKKRKDTPDRSSGKFALGWLKK
ncbi:hypothetical protein AAF712_008363 [Marasmius tenuissimus]|uniref:Uncharacterized protein n=1 Tax=Marasmius tenuissimus TaxID=585030 RepID=A0ABR2ZSM6_9AGAR